MSIQLPLSGSELITAAQKELDSEMETVKDGLISEILPKAIEVIFSHHEPIKAILKANPALVTEDVVSDLAQTLWSYPGSLGAVRVRDIFARRGCDLQESETLAESVVVLTKYPMSIVNYSRHIGSSIRSFSRAADGPKSINLRVTDLALPEEFMNTWRNLSEQINDTCIKDDESFNNFLSMVEQHLQKYFQAQMSEVRERLGSPSESSSSPASASNIARAYVRRFGNFVQAKSTLKQISTSNNLIDATVLNRYAKIKKKFEESDELIYELLYEDFQKRSRRLSASTSQLSANNRMLRSTHSRAGVEQSLNINGKRVEIRSSSAHLSNSLIEGFIKSFNLQHNLSPDEPVLSSRFMIDGEFLEVEAERPAKVDLKKIQTFIESMYRS